MKKLTYIGTDVYVSLVEIIHGKNLILEVSQSVPELNPIVLGQTFFTIDYLHPILPFSGHVTPKLKVHFLPRS